MRLSHGRIEIELHPLRRGRGLPLLLLHQLGGGTNDWAEGSFASWQGSVYGLDFAGHAASPGRRGLRLYPGIFPRGCRLRPRPHRKGSGLRARRCRHRRLRRFAAGRHAVEPDPGRVAAPGTWARRRGFPSQTTPTGRSKPSRTGSRTRLGASRNTAPRPTPASPNARSISDRTTTSKSSSGMRGDCFSANRLSASGTCLAGGAWSSRVPRLSTPPRMPNPRFACFTMRVAGLATHSTIGNASCEASQVIESR